jgi:predicted hydrocarbon binding protein
MSQNVSSKVLFHFTKSLDAIKSILSDGFFPHYCPEYTLHPNDLLAAHNRRHPWHAIPMVSFCDLPLSLIGKHLKEYGYFGIGLKKTWGINNRVAPVLYTHYQAGTRPALWHLYSELWRRSSSNLTGNIDKNAAFLAAHAKPFQGTAWRNGKIRKKVRFYDEREWRYVPPLPAKAEYPEAGLFCGFDEYMSGKDVLREELKKKFSLKVTPDDIQYLIVKYDKGEKNVIELHDFIMRSFRRQFSRKDAILVSTAIMTHDCIRDDI